MRLRRLGCFDGFQCPPGTCPDTCCAGWEIDLDEEILETYGALPGALGEEIRSKITREDGYTFFRCEDGRCPFLNADGLCRLILEADGGQTLLGEVCREHPRFHEIYGDLTETCLAISCPEAAGLLLEAEPALPLTTGEDLRSGETDPDEALLTLLEDAREQLFHIVTGAAPMGALLAFITREALRLQAAVDNGEASFSFGPIPACGEETTGDLLPWLRCMQGMEFTDHRLQDLLTTALSKGGKPAAAAFPPELQADCRKLLVYFLYRYLLRSVRDEDVLGKLGLAVRSVEAIAYLAGFVDLPPRQALRETAILYSREVEHSDENLELLYDEVWRELLPV